MTVSTALSRAVLGGLALVHITCHQAILTADPSASLTLFINPGFIPAHGGVAVVSAFLQEETGTPVPDGTVVQFLTSLGRIDEQGKTNDGVARVNLVSDARSGMATITAFSGLASDSQTVEIGAILPANVFVTADPPRIVLSVSRTSHIIATVLDGSGNPVANVPLVFRVAIDPNAPNRTDFIEDGDAPVFTDTNGRAERILRTQRAAGSAAGSATVIVTTLSATGVTGQVVVPIQ